jgi:hypothetical protein
VPEENFQRSIKTANRCSLDVLRMFLGKAVVSDQLKNANLNGESKIALSEAKTTLALVCGDALPVEPLWVGTKFKLEPSPGRHYIFNETVMN